MRSPQAAFHNLSPQLLAIPKSREFIESVLSSETKHMVCSGCCQGDDVASVLLNLNSLQGSTMRVSYVDAFS